MDTTHTSASESLAHDLQMNKPFASLQHEASIALLVTAERLRSFIHMLCQKHNITSQQYNIMRILRGSYPNALSCSDINCRMLQHSPDITRLLTRLETAGYIERTRDPDDNRVVRTAILPKGLQLVNAMDKTIEESYSPFSILTPQENKILIAMLHNVRQELDTKL